MAADDRCTKQRQTERNKSLETDQSFLHETQLYFTIKDSQWPIVFTSEYNIGFLGLEKLHPFDSGKWGKIFEFLKEVQMVRDSTVVTPVEASKEDLLVVHTRGYIDSLKFSFNVAGITEVPPVACLPNFIVQRKILRPLRFQTGGTILAGKLAMERGWAINLGGGFHHCSSQRGGGFCAYADITLSLRFLFQRVEGVAKAMIIDLDAHQGNGHERDFINDDKVYIMDVYNRSIYPHDGYAKHDHFGKWTQVLPEWRGQDLDVCRLKAFKAHGLTKKVRNSLSLFTHSRRHTPYMGAVFGNPKQKAKISKQQWSFLLGTALSILIEGEPVLNRIEGFWWPCKLILVEPDERWPYTISFFNEDTVLECRKREVIKFDSETAKESLARLSQKRNVSKILVQKFTDDCELAEKLLESNCAAKLFAAESEMKVDEASLTAENTPDLTSAMEMKADEESLTAEITPALTTAMEMKANEESLTAEITPALTTAMEMNADEASLTAEITPALTTAMEMKANEESLTAEITPALTTAMEMKANEESLTAEITPALTTAMEMKANEESLTAEITPALTTAMEMKANEESLTAEITPALTTAMEMNADEALLTAEITPALTTAMEMKANEESLTAEITPALTTAMEMKANEESLTAEITPALTTAMEMKANEESLTAEITPALTTAMEMNADEASLTAEITPALTTAMEMKANEESLTAEITPNLTSAMEMKADKASLTANIAPALTKPLINSDNESPVHNAPCSTAYSILQRMTIGLNITNVVPDCDEFDVPWTDFKEIAKNLHVPDGLDECCPSGDSDSEYVPNSESEEDSEKDPADDMEVVTSSTSIDVLAAEKNGPRSTTPESVERSNPRTASNTDQSVIATSVHREFCCDKNSHTLQQGKSVITDSSSPGIFIRKITKSLTSKLGKRKKSDRVYQNYHCCFICCKLVSNIITHLNQHKEAEEVQKLISIQIDANKEEARTEQIFKQKECRHFQALLRNRGDHEHNVKVMESGKGELLISRRPDEFRANEYGPCPLCYEWIKLEASVAKHQSTCPAVGNSKKLTKGESIIRSAVLSGQLKPEASSGLIKEVFPIMTRDKQTEVAKSDPLIIGLGNSWLRRNIGNKLKRKNYTSSRMRGAARLLLQLRDITGEDLSMSEFLQPRYFDNVALAALKCAMQAIDDEEDLAHPSAAIKLGFDIGRLADVKLGLAMRSQDKQLRKEASDLLTLMKLEWTEKVSKLAHTVLNERKMAKTFRLPIPEDLSKLSKHIKAELMKLDLCKKEANLLTFYRAAKLSQARILVYNKRRSGELEAMTLINYQNRSEGLDESDQALMSQDLTEMEKYLISSQEIIKIRGKVSRIVPVLVTEDASPALDYITDSAVRTRCGIHQDNIFVFANTGAGVQRSYDSLKMFCEEANLDCPDRVTSVNLRKYMATMTQILELKEHELQWVCSHLGHTTDVHKLHYRSTSGFIERVNIGKIMLLQDFNLTAKYAGMQIKDIQIQEVLGGSVTIKTPANPAIEPEEDTVETLQTVEETKNDSGTDGAIKRRVELESYTEDEEYLTKVRRHVDGALNEFTPDIVVYNAGTDILDGDPLGRLAISAQGIIERDQVVFQRVRTRGIPILMVTSGGYTRGTARIIADSILNLKNLGLIHCEEAELLPADPILSIPKSRSEGGLFAKLRASCTSIHRSPTSIDISSSNLDENLPVDPH